MQVINEMKKDRMLGIERWYDGPIMAAAKGEKRGGCIFRVS
jgi:hypothetical protein